MANTSTSGEVQASELTGTELVRCVQGGADKKTTVSEIAATIPSVATVAALPAASTKNGKIYVVENPASNAIALPAMVRSNGSKWQFVNGDALITEECAERMYTVPAITFDGATYSMASVNAGAETRITDDAGGAHGLTTAAQITAGDSYIPVLGGTNWTPGWYKITVVDSASAATINHPYSASLGQPTFGLAGSTLVALRLKLPPLSVTGKARLNYVADHTHSVADSTSISVEHVATGGAAGSGYDVHDPFAETTNAPIISVRCGFNNFGATNVQKTMFAPGDADGWSALNTGAIASGAVQTSSGSDLIIVVVIQTAGDSIKISNYDLRVSL